MKNSVISLLVLTLLCGGVCLLGASVVYAQNQNDGYWRSTTANDPYPLTPYSQDVQPAGPAVAPVSPDTPVSNTTTTNSYDPRPGATIPVTYLTPTPTVAEEQLTTTSWDWKTYTLLIILAIVIALIAFFAGRRFRR